MKVTHHAYGYDDGGGPGGIKRTVPYLDSRLNVNRYLSSLNHPRSPSASGDVDNDDR